MTRTWEASMQGGYFVLETREDGSLRAVAEVSGDSREQCRENVHLMAAALAMKESLTNLVALAERRGRLDEYKAALDDARSALQAATYGLQHVSEN